MKVYMGPYPDNWWTTRDWAERILARRHGMEFGFEVEEEDYDWVDRAVVDFSRFWQRVLNVTINPILRRTLKRKISVRIDPYDTWGMDVTLAHIILPMLKQLKETKHGSPWVDDEDVPHMVKKSKKKTKKVVPQDIHAVSLDDEEDQHSDVHERWDWVMDEMIWTFEQILADDEGMKNYYDPYEPGEEVDRLGWKDSKTGEMKFMQSEESARKMGKYNPEKHTAYTKRIQNGTLLFGKYYQGLWD